MIKMNLNRNEVEYLINLTLKDIRRNSIRQGELDKHKIFEELKKSFPNAVVPTKDFKKCREVITYILTSHDDLEKPIELFDIYERMVGKKNIKLKLSTFKRETSRMKSDGLLKPNGGRLSLKDLQPRMVM